MYIISDFVMNLGTFQTFEESLDRWKAFDIGLTAKQMCAVLISRKCTRADKVEVCVCIVMINLDLTAVER